jgi:multidrug efflux pump subunit AcrA (membrane-fusion protein)
MVSLNQPLARVGDNERLLLRLAVDERDIARISEDQTVLFTTDLLPDTILSAQVSRIHPFLNQADRSFTVEARVAPTELSLYPGSTVEANIIIRQADRALVIPKTVLLGQDSVWVVRDGERQRVRITTGVDNMEAVEVVAGLDETTQVIVP